MENKKGARDGMSNEFELGYEHGRRDALLITPITKNMGFWTPIGMLLGIGLTYLVEFLK